MDERPRVAATQPHLRRLLLHHLLEDVDDVARTTEIELQHRDPLLDDRLVRHLLLQILEERQLFLGGLARLAILEGVGQFLRQGRSLVVLPTLLAIRQKLVCRRDGLELLRIGFRRMCPHQREVGFFDLGVGRGGLDSENVIGIVELRQR
jgi:hypothetical protein